MQFAERNAAAVAAQASAAELPAALPDTRPLAVAPCGIVVAHVAVLAAGTPTRPDNINTNH